MCKVQWLANDHPSVNRKPFTEGEYEKLVAAVESVQGASQEDLFDDAPIDWQAVADIVGASPALLKSKATYTDSFPEWPDCHRLLQGLQKQGCSEDRPSQMDRNDRRRTPGSNPEIGRASCRERVCLAV